MQEGDKFNVLQRIIAEINKKIKRKTNKQRWSSLITSLLRQW